MKPRKLPDLFKAIFLKRFNPREQLQGDVARNPSQLFLSSFAENDVMNHTTLYTYWVYSATRRAVPGSLRLGEADLES